VSLVCDLSRRSEVWRVGKFLVRGTIEGFGFFNLFMALISLRSATEVSVEDELGESGSGVCRGCCFTEGCVICRGGVDLVSAFFFL
jgi:hypothetical protein